jgi:hypothetical protein
VFCCCSTLSCLVLFVLSCLVWSYINIMSRWDRLELAEPPEVLVVIQNDQNCPFCLVAFVTATIVRAERHSRTDRFAWCVVGAATIFLKLCAKLFDVDYTNGNHDQLVSMEQGNRPDCSDVTSFKSAFYIIFTSSIKEVSMASLIDHCVIGMLIPPLP